MSNFIRIQNQSRFLKLSFIEAPSLSYTTMIKAVSTAQEENLPIHGFSSEGYLVYPDKINGHFLWDVPEAHMCNPACPCLDDPYDDDEDFEIMRRRRRRKKSSHPKIPCKSHSPEPPDDPASNKPLPIYKKALKWIKKEDIKATQQEPIPSPTKLRIDAEKEQPSLFTKTQSLPVPAPFFDTYQPFYHPSKPPMDYNKFFGLSSLFYRNQEPTQSTPKKPATKAPVHQYYYQSVGLQNNGADSDSSSNDSSSSYEQSSSDSESQYVDISGLLMVQPSTKTEELSTSTPGVHESDEESENKDQDSSQTEPVPPSSASESSSKPSSTPRFTFDDIPRHKWPTRYQEFAAWIDIHYKWMSMLYYKLNGFNDPTLKHVFIASLPPKLQLELQRQITAFNLDIANISLGKIFQLTMLCLDKICEQKDFFKDLIENRQPFASVCKKPYLKIQCKDDKKCTCSTKMKGHFQKHSHKSSSKKFKKPYRYFKKKDPPQFRKKKHNKCFICKKRGHFARTVQTSLPKLFILSNIYNNLQCFLTKKMLNQISLNRQNKMIKRHSSLQNLETILTLKKFLLSLHFRKLIKSMFYDCTLSDTFPLYSSITQKLLQFCPENHSQFNHPFPLWKNSKFFIHLPIKLNEDINPTKATHPGMSPSDLLLAKQECDQFLQQGLIKPTTSDWAYQVFYVEKRSELVRGKKRLVIDYQPLNAFLRDDKFSLPKIQSLFVHL
ncbi:hypothetical protein KPL70_014223 [Citrus sinensis]|nr:hypothetical protein KPL70_014223 [Citrus sinensis]